MLAGAVALGFADFLSGGTLGANPMFWKLMESLVVGGISLEAGALAQAIGSQKGIGITTRAAAGNRQIIYGQQRVGGTAVYESTTGSPGNSGNYVYNYIIAVATHEIDAFINLYLDGRQVFWRPDGNPANIGCGSVATPPTTSVTIAGGAITGITATGGSGFANVKPTRYRVRIQGDGTGAVAWATNSGTPSAPVWLVSVTSGGSGYTTATAEIQGKYTFGGFARPDNPDPSGPGYGLGYGIGPGGPHYNFDGKVFAEVRFGDQPAGDYMASATAYDPTWPTSARGAGIAYIFVGVGYEPSQFPGAPEIKITVNGKNDIYDPRTGLKGFTTNWALQVADVLTDPVYGVGDVVNQAQLIAAANVCDELVTTSQGSETRYAQSIHYDTSVAPGEVLAMMMPSGAGRLSYIAGEWWIWPAYWQGVTFNQDKSALIDAPQWNPKRSFRDLFNRVNGTYVAPNYPYNVAGNLYDKNGWYYGTISNDWPFAWQPTNFPQYAADVLHGYSSDAYLTEDGGVQLPYELSLKGVISITQAQRVAKIFLMRNRQQGSGTLPMQLAGYQMQETDVMQMTFPELGWTNKYLEVTKGEFFLKETRGQNDQTAALALGWNVTVRETDPSEYAWSLSEELTPYDVPAFPGSIATAPAAPTGLSLTDDSSTAVLQQDGSTMPRLLVQWTPPADNLVNLSGKIQVRYQDADGTYLSGAWISAADVTGDATYCYINGIPPLQHVTVGLRSMRSNGQTSDWVYVSNYLIVRPRPLLGSTSQIPGTTVNPSLGSSFADLPELGSSDPAMSIATQGNSALVGIQLAFKATSGSGSTGGVTGIGWTPSSTVPYGTPIPSISISISGDGGGASAYVTWSYSMSDNAYHASLSITPGSGYTAATATVTITNGSGSYPNGTSTYTCSVSTATASPGATVTVQVLVDGSPAMGPFSQVTDSNGNAQFTQLSLLSLAAGTHVFQVQALASSGSSVVSKSRQFQLVQLS